MAIIFLLNALAAFDRRAGLRLCAARAARQSPESNAGGIAPRMASRW